MTTAQDVMNSHFHTLRPDASIADAVSALEEATAAENRRIFGMMVIDQSGRLVGMLSMYDILLFIRPKHINIWGMMEDIEIAGLLEEVCQRAKSVRVEDIMTTEIITVTPDTQIMVILDIMIKKHVRRIPVIEDGVIHGIIYLSDLFDYLGAKLVS